MMVENFNAKERTVLTVFTKVNAPFYIPIYQRKYNWTVDNEIMELIEDLENFYRENGTDPEASYYLGNIVVKSKINEITEEVDEMILIDGQQRLTTILLFINYMRHSLSELKDVDIVERDTKIKSLENILYIYRGNDKGDRRLKIKNPASDNILRKIFEITGSTNNDNLLLESNYFKNFKGIKDILNITTIEEWDKWLSILRRIKIAQITLGRKDKEISAFESINSKGLPLNTLDLIKNYLFLVSENSNLNEDSKERINDTMSNKLEKLFLKGNGEKDEKSINRFFAAFISKEKSIDPIKEKKVLYKIFKTLIPNKISQEDFSIFMDNLEQSIDIYSNLIKLGKSFKTEVDVKSYAKSYLADSKLDMYLPLFLIVGEKVNNKTIDLIEEQNIYELLDMHNMALSITNKKNKDNRFLFKYISSVKGDVRYESLLKYLTMNFENNSRLTTPQEFSSGVKHSDIYTIDSKVARYILYRIENHIRKKSGEKINFNFTLEHIFPVDDKNWTDKFDSLEYKGTYIHTLGNLTLVKGKLNSEMSNSKYSKKILKIKESSLKINNYLIDEFKDWKIISELNNDPLKRSDNLMNYIKEVWPIEVMELVKINSKISKKDKILNSIDKLSIVEGIKIVLAEAYPKSMTLGEISSSLIELCNYIIETGFDIKITFNTDKISTGGWMTERIYSNWVEKEGSKRFEKPLFEKENKNWKITKETFDSI